MCNWFVALLPCLPSELQAVVLEQMLCQLELGSVTAAAYGCFESYVVAVNFGDGEYRPFSELKGFEELWEIAKCAENAQIRCHATKFLSRLPIRQERNPKSAGEDWQELVRLRVLTRP